MTTAPHCRRIPTNKAKRVISIMTPAKSAIGYVFMAMSLDGYIARADGNLDWLMKQKTESEDHGCDTFMASVDGLIMGRG
jgi:hypothetical protein